MTASSNFRLPKILWACVLVGAAALFGTQSIAQDAPEAPAATEAPGAPAPGETPDPDKVYATVDGEPITEADLAVAAEDYAQELSRMPAEVRIEQLLNAVIDIRLLAAAAEEAGLAEDDLVKRKIALDRARTLQNAYLRQSALESVTDTEVKARFDEEVAKFEPGDEYHLHHILVETEDEGKEVIADLEEGGDFAEIAREKSKDPGSGANGGDLGFLPKGRTVPEFEQAAFALEVGEVTGEPVQSQFGWHVIKLEEKRKESPPELATEEQRIRGELIREFIDSRIQSLRAEADIEIVAPEASPDAGDAGGESAPAEGGTEAPAPQ